MSLRGHSHHIFQCVLYLLHQLFLIIYTVGPSRPRRYLGLSYIWITAWISLCLCLFQYGLAQPRRYLGFSFAST